MSPVVSILYICESCRTIRQLDISKEELIQEGELFKIKDVHANHEAILYLNSKNIPERVVNEPPVPRSNDLVVKGLVALKEEKEKAESAIEIFEGSNKVYIPTRDLSRMPINLEMNQLIVLNMNGDNTLGDIYTGLKSEWEELTPEHLITFIRNLEVRGWIKLKDSE